MCPRLTKALPPQPAGGASIVASLATPTALVGCQVADGFDGTYDVWCPPTGGGGMAGAQVTLNVMLQVGLGFGLPKPQTLNPKP